MLDVIIVLCTVIETLVALHSIFKDNKKEKH